MIFIIAIILELIIIFNNIHTNIDIRANIGNSVDIYTDIDIYIDIRANIGNSVDIYTDIDIYIDIHANIGNSVDIYTDIDIDENDDKIVIKNSNKKSATGIIIDIILNDRFT